MWRRCRAVGADHGWRELGRKVLRAWVTGWMDIETTTAAPQYPQLVVCAGFPKERRERIERGHRPRWQRIGDRAGHLDRHRLAGTDPKVDVPLLHYLAALAVQVAAAL